MQHAANVRKKVTSRETICKAESRGPIGQACFWDETGKLVLRYLHPALKKLDACMLSSRTHPSHVLPRLKKLKTFHTSEHSCSGTLKESQHDHMVQWAKQFHYSCNEISQSNQTRNHPAKGCFENAEFKHAFITTSQKTVQSPKHTCDQQAATLSAQTI